MTTHHCFVSLCFTMPNIRTILGTDAPLKYKWPACAHLTDANQGVNAERAERAILGFVKSVINGMLLVSINMVILSSTVYRKARKILENFGNIIKNYVYRLKIRI